jgi:excisionase family DNA binding protein
LTTEEVLEYLQVNLRTVYRLIKAGKIPAVRVGRQWRFRKRDIDAWLESQRPRQGRGTAGAPRVVTPAVGRPRILVVDDEAAIRDLLSKTLALAEYDVDLAPDGRTALERLRHIPYDLLITDLKMSATAIVIVEPLTIGPQYCGMSKRVRAVAGSRPSGWSAKPAQNQTCTCPVMTQPRTPPKKMYRFGLGSSVIATPPKTVSASAANVAVHAYTWAFVALPVNQATIS